MKPLIVLLLLASLLACAQRDTGAAPALADLRGQWVVINYWAKWCAPCIEEIPELNALDRKYEQVTVLGVNYDGATGAELQEQLSALGVDFPQLMTDPSAELGIPRPVVLPTTLILDPEGVLVASLVGPQTLASLAAAIGQSPAEVTE